MVSQLELEIPDTRSVKTLRILDNSLYNSKIEVECGILEITPPGYNNSVNFNVAEGFSFVANSSNLKIAKTKVFSKLQALPDGVYQIKYSIKPNDFSWVEYDHLRISKIMHDYYTQLCCLKLKACEPDKETHLKLKQLREIRLFIDTAKAEVEECGNRTRGTELYDYARRLLNTFSDSNCLTCK